MQRGLPHILALNGSLRGSAGNTARLLGHAARAVQGRAHMSQICLADFSGSTASLLAVVRRADALLFGSGVYWNSHGSPLQRFLEVATAWETSQAFLGKAAGVVLTLDSVGGMEVASRLLGTLNLLGCMVPPLAVVLLSRVGMASAHSVDQEDVYSPADIPVLMHNVLLAASLSGQAWQRWDVRKTAAPGGPYAAPGALHIDQAPWLA